MSPTQRSIAWLSFTVAFLFAASVSLAGGKTVTVKLKITCHKKAQLADTDADRIVKDMTTVLQTIDDPAGSDDVVCDIKFVRDGNVTPFNIGDGSIDSEAEWQEVYNGVNAHVIVVRAINWCEKPGPAPFGCAPAPGARLVVERINGRQEGILWAHEFGHNRGLYHRNKDHAVMRDFIADSHRRISPFERDMYLVAQTLLGAQGRPAAQVQAPMHKPAVDVTTFVRRTYFHGVPWDEASRYQEEHVQTLLDMLSNAEEKQYLTNVVETLALIGDRRAVDPLIKFISQGDGELTKPEYEARLAAVMHLGTLHKKTEEIRPLDFLVESAETPTVWNRRITWNAPERERQEVRDDLTGMSLWGLALSGSAKGKATLEGLASGKVNLSPSTKPIVQEAMQAWKLVNDKGLIEYYRSRAAGHNSHEK